MLLAPLPIEIWPSKWAAIRGDTQWPNSLCLADSPVQRLVAALGLVPTTPCLDASTRVPTAQNTSPVQIESVGTDDPSRIPGPAEHDGLATSGGAHPR